MWTTKLRHCAWGQTVSKLNKEKIDYYSSSTKLMFKQLYFHHDHKRTQLTITLLLSPYNVTVMVALTSSLLVAAMCAPTHLTITTLVMEWWNWNTMFSCMTFKIFTHTHTHTCRQIDSKSFSIICDLWAGLH